MVDNNNSDDEQDSQNRLSLIRKQKQQKQLKESSERKLRLNLLKELALKNSRMVEKLHDRKFS